jgi:RND family efflux transporter MFP subunit
MALPTSRRSSRFSSQALIALIIAAAFAAGWFVSARLAGPGAGGPPAGMMGGSAAPPAVRVQTAHERFIDQEKEYIAHVEPIQEVDLLPRIEGYIEAVHFDEGSLVERGQLLFTIDPREYQATVNLRAAELAQAEARLVRAEKYLKRLEAAEPRSISQTDLDTAVSDVLSAQAAVDMARAGLELARIDLGYTRITAPISGRIGPAETKAGNYVSSGTQRLARIVQVHPVRVAFSPADRHYLHMLEQIHAGDNPQISTRLLLPGGMELTTAGRRDFVNNEIDPATGTITVWLRFDNPDGMLIPGSYVKLLLGRQDRPRAVMVPQAAVITDAHGDYVYVVDNATQVQQRRVDLGAVVPGGVVVASGLAAGETVIVEGIQKVRPGITVTAVSSTPDHAEGSRQ